MALCFALSTAFHTLMAHSEAVYLLNMKLDFQGVLVLMWAATVPLVYYSFPCDRDWPLRAGYWALISGLALACSAVTFLPCFSGPHLGPYRALLFGTFGVGSFALPIAHGIVRHGLGEEWERAGLGWILWTVVCDGIGVLVYGLKVSRLSPSSFAQCDTAVKECPLFGGRTSLLMFGVISFLKDGSPGASISLERAIN